MILDIYSSLFFPIGITSFIRLLFIDKGSDSVCNNQIKKGKSKQISKNLSLNGCQHRDVPLVPFYGQPHTTQSHPSGTTCRTRRVRCVVPDGCDEEVSSIRTRSSIRCLCDVMPYRKIQLISPLPKQRWWSAS